MEVNNVNIDEQAHAVDRSPSGLSILWREIVRDKVALFSLILLVLIGLFVYGTSIFLDQAEIVKVDLFAIHEPPSSEFLLGTDKGGRDIFGQLIIGTRNSLSIGILVDRKSTRLNSSHVAISYAVFCLKNKIHEDD